MRILAVHNDHIKKPDPERKYGCVCNKCGTVFIHHKKRINKKWLKRYGYKEQLFNLGRWNCKSTDQFGEEYKFTRKVIDDANSDSTSKRI